MGTPRPPRPCARGQGTSATTTFSVRSGRELSRGSLSQVEGRNPCSWLPELPSGWAGRHTLPWCPCLPRTTLPPALTLGWTLPPCRPPPRSHGPRPASLGSWPPPPLLTCPDRFRAWRRVGGHSPPAAQQPGRHVQCSPCAQDPLGLRMGTRETLLRLPQIPASPRPTARVPGFGLGPTCPQLRSGLWAAQETSLSPPAAEAPHKEKPSLHVCRWTALRSVGRVLGAAGNNGVGCWPSYSCQGQAGKRRRGPGLPLHVGPHPAPCRCLLSRPISAPGRQQVCPLGSHRPGGRGGVTRQGGRQAPHTFLPLPGLLAGLNNTRGRELLQEPSGACEPVVRRARQQLPDHWAPPHWQGRGHPAPSASPGEGPPPLGATAPADRGWSPGLWEPLSCGPAQSCRQVATEPGVCHTDPHTGGKAAEKWGPSRRVGGSPSPTTSRSRRPGLGVQAFMLEFGRAWEPKVGRDRALVKFGGDPSGTLKTPHSPPHSERKEPERNDNIPVISPTSRDPKGPNDFP